jgi:hypothetical protein
MAIRKDIMSFVFTHSLVSQFAIALGLHSGAELATDVLSPYFLSKRIISYRLDPALHPVDGDDIVNLCRNGIKASMLFPSWSLQERLMNMIWFAAIPGAPRPLVRWLAEKLYYPETRRWLNRLLMAFRGCTDPV